MNYLAHIYLSGNDDFIKIGNFIADGIKGKKYQLFEPTIQKGILLHRQIDSFTDSNEIVRQSKRRLDAGYNLYRGIIIDILYDHFLAKNWSKYSGIPLDQFSHSFYDLLRSHHEMLPDRIKNLMPVMIKEDWLTSYATLEGINKILFGMNKRTEERANIHLAINDLVDNYDDFEKDFTQFFEKLRNFSALKIEELNNEFN